MKALIQRVTTAKVTVNDELISAIGRGLCILVGISVDDTVKDVEYLTRKILNLRLFEADGRRWQTNIVQEELEILCVSQFTLYHRLKGNKPDFHLAMQGDDAKKLYDLLLEQLGDGYDSSKIKDGKFGAFMQVHIQNDGPVTLEIESPAKEEKADKKTKVQVVKPIVS